jgi:hypothetical protein
MRIVAWGALIMYLADAANSFYQNIYNAIVNGFPIDIYFSITTVSRVFVGAVLFMLLQAAAKVLLILMDIEDNTRRAARGNGKE